MTELTPQKLKTRIDSGEPVELIDVRSPELFSEKHIPGALNVPHGEKFADEAKKALNNDMDNYLVVYGAHEEQKVAESACKELGKAGFEKVHHLNGGLMGWVEAGGTVEFGKSS